MKKVILERPNLLSIKDASGLIIEENKVIVKVAACGVCGSDLAIYRGERDIVGYFGHEFSGTIKEKDPKIPDLNVGNRVTTGVIRTCGYCKSCKIQKPNFCKDLEEALSPGGFSEQCSVLHTPQYQYLIKIPSNLDFVPAVLHEPISCALRIAKQSKATYFSTVVIFGLGTIGILSGLLLKKIFCVKRLIGVDINSARLKIAENIGFFDRFVNSYKQDFLIEIEKYTNSMKVDVAIDTSGAAKTFEQAIESVRLGGRVVLGGVPCDSIQFRPLSIFRKEISIVAAKGPYPYVYSNGISEELKIIQDEIIPWEKIISVYPFEKIDCAFSDVLSGKTLKAVVQM